MTLLIARRLRAAIALRVLFVAGIALQAACKDDGDNECVIDADCPEGAICNDITDECEQGCRLDEDCRSGLICETRRVRPGVSQRQRLRGG
jgi:hypothetical protein